MAKRTIRRSEELDSLRKERDLLSIALQCAVAEKPDATTRAETEDGWTFHYDLYRATGAAGGIVTVTASTDGQRPFVWAAYLDDLRHDPKFYSLPEEQRLAVWRLTVARQKMEDALRIPA